MKVEVGQAQWGYVWHTIYRHPSSQEPKALCNPVIAIEDKSTKQGKPDCLACRRVARSYG